MTRHCKHGITGGHCADPECDSGRWDVQRGQVNLPGGAAFCFARWMVIRRNPEGGVKRDLVTIEGAYCRAGEKRGFMYVIGLGPECTDAEAVAVKVLRVLQVEGAAGSEEGSRTWAQTIAKAAVNPEEFLGDTYRLL